MSPRLRSVPVVAALLALCGSLAWVTHRLSGHEQQLAALRSEKSGGEDQPAAAGAPVPIYVYLDGANAAAKASGAATESRRASQPAERSGAGDDDAEAGGARRRAERIARFDHIQEIFAALTERPVDGPRAQRVRTSFEAEVEGFRKSPPAGVQLGTLECRGRMCALPVAFDAPEKIEAVVGAARRSAIAVAEPSGETPLVHLLSRPDADERTSVGRLYFEWLDRGEGAQAQAR
jgi:hypothetical protein